MTQPYYDGSDEDLNEVYYLLLLFIRAVGVPSQRYYMQQLWLGVPHNHPLFEKQLLRVIVEFL